jgi:hypothetical protein
MKERKPSKDGMVTTERATSGLSASRDGQRMGQLWEEMGDREPALREFLVRYAMDAAGRAATHCGGLPRKYHRALTCELVNFGVAQWDVLRQAYMGSSDGSGPAEPS